MSSTLLLKPEERFVCPNCSIWVKEVVKERSYGCRCGQCGDEFTYTANCNCLDPYSNFNGYDYNWEEDLDDWIERELYDKRTRDAINRFREGSAG